jgi:hypothetical protein
MKIKHVGWTLLSVAGLLALSWVATSRATRAAAGGGLQGTWTVRPSETKDGGGPFVQLGLQRGSLGHRWDSSFRIELRELQGLGAEPLQAADAEARFALVRDGGRLDFEGRFRAGQGAGHFTFTSSREYLDALRQKGYGDVDEEKALSLAVHDVSRTFIKELASLGYERLPMDQLVSLRIHGAGPSFIRDLKGLGYDRLMTDQLVSLRIHGATPEFIRDLKGVGYERLTPDQLVSLRIHGASPAFVRELKDLGYAQVPVDEVVSMRIHGVTPDFVRRAVQKAGTKVPVSELVSMRIHGRTP